MQLACNEWGWRIEIGGKRTEVRCTFVRLMREGSFSSEGAEDGHSEVSSCEPWTGFVSLLLIVVC